ncbi:MAG: tetratricopeptide repeat protein [Actinomycetota bacterium]
MKTKILVSIACILALHSLSLNSQDRNEVITVYNEGAKAMQTDVPAAIAAFEKVITLADQVGETANDLKQKAVQVLPGLYYKQAATAYNEKKTASEIIAASKLAGAMAEKYGSKTHGDNSKKILINGYYKLATDYFSANDYDNAMLAFDSVLALNSDHIASIYNKALIYRNRDDADSYEQTIDLFLGKLDPVKDADKATQAKGSALEYFRAAGSKANSANNLDEALTLLTRAAKYGDDKTLFYFFADVYNKQSNFSEGAAFAQKGLDLETGDAEDKAMFYYQLAVAQVGQGNTAAACESFKNAQYGPFAEAAKAQRTNLKCE